MLDLNAIGLWGLFIGTFLSATVVPFSSEAMYLLALYANEYSPWVILLVATAGNSLGSVTTYYVGRIGKWEWIEKYFRVKRESLERQKRYIDRFGVWMGFLTWVPFIGDIIALALGFYKFSLPLSVLSIIIGKFARFGLMTLIVT